MAHARGLGADLSLYVLIALGAIAAWWLGGGRAKHHQRVQQLIASQASELRDSLDTAFAAVHDYRTAGDADWAGLDRAFYRDACATLEQAEFAIVADLVDVTIQRAFPDLRAVLRVLLGDGGRTRVGVYHVRLRGWKRVAQVLGFAARHLKCVELVSELDDGRFLSTSNTLGLDKLSFPEAIYREQLPRATSVADLLARHRDRIAAMDRSVFVVMADAADMLRSMQRGNLLVARHRDGIGPLTAEELRQYVGRPLNATEQRLLEQLRAPRGE